MEITVERKSFQESFGLAAAAADVRGHKAVLQYVLARTTPDGLVMIGTNLEATVTTLCSAEITGTGTVLLPVNRLKQIINESQDEKLVLRYDGDGKLFVLGVRDRFTLQVPDHDDFPVMKSPGFDNARIIDAALLATAIRRTAFATDVASSRYALGGILVEPGEDVIHFVGTDGHRLSHYTASSKEKIGKGIAVDSTVIVPHSNSRLLMSILSGGGNALISATENAIYVKCGESDVSVRLLEGRFPRWRMMTEADYERIKIDMPVGVFRSALRKAAITSGSENTRGIDFSISTGEMVLTSATADVGEGVCQVPVSYVGEDVTIRLDVDYLSESMSDLDGNTTIEFHFADAEKPVLLTTGSEWEYIVMPIGPDKKD